MWHQALNNTTLYQDWEWTICWSSTFLQAVPTTHMVSFLYDEHLCSFLCHFVTFIIISTLWHILPCHRARGSAPSWQRGAVRDKQVQCCIATFIYSMKYLMPPVKNPFSWGMKIILVENFLWGVFLLMHSSVCAKMACMQEKMHAVCVFTSPTLSRLSSLSSREVVYKGS